MTDLFVVFDTDYKHNDYSEKEARHVFLQKKKYYVARVYPFIPQQFKDLFYVNYTKATTSMVPFQNQSQTTKYRYIYLLYNNIEHIQNMLTKLVNDPYYAVEVSELPRLQRYNTVDMKIPVDNCHIGQRKLLLTEIQFLTNKKSGVVVYAGSAPGNHIPVLLKIFPNKFKWILIDPNFHYFKGNKEYLYQNPEAITSTYPKKDMMEYFPAMQTKINISKNKSQLSMKRFYDLPDDWLKPRLTKAKDTVYIIQDYISDTLAHKLHDLGVQDCYYISDLRTTFFDKDGPTDGDMLLNDYLNI